ncbi:hypothetical protein BH10CYA1_BH10CYA1_23240 [soil metagenome]
MRGRCLLYQLEAEPAVSGLNPPSLKVEVSASAKVPLINVSCASRGMPERCKLIAFLKKQPDKLHLSEVEV